MLKKTTSGGGAGLMGCDTDTQAPSPLTRHSNGGRPSSSSSLLLSPTPRSLFSVDASTSPTSSMLEQPKNPPCSSPRNRRNGHSCGAGIAAVLVAGEAEREHRGSGRVLLGMRLRVRLPPEKGFDGSVAAGDLPSSPIEFGVKNRDAQLALLSPVQRSPLSSAARAAQSEVEELAEDYTCVIARGPNPKMIHIFDDRVVESFAGTGAAGDGCSQLSSCYGCKKRLGQLHQFLHHRGEKAFCSSQCRYRDVLFDKGIRDSPDASVKLKPWTFSA